jgi:hypothetical protein
MKTNPQELDVKKIKESIAKKKAEIKKAGKIETAFKSRVNKPSISD